MSERLCLSAKRYAQKTNVKWPKNFWINVDASRGDDACWIWTGYTRNGYGSVKYKDRNEYAHILVYQNIKGVIPDGYEVDHSCRVRRCINPDHLEAITKRLNRQRQAWYGGTQTAKRLTEKARNARWPK
jgi:hypothetical protein